MKIKEKTKMLVAAISVLLAGGIMACDNNANVSVETYDETTTVFASGVDDLANKRVHSSVQGYASSNLRSEATSAVAVSNLTDGAVSEGSYIIANTTGGDTNPWFAVDLGETKEINKVRIVPGVGQHADVNENGNYINYQDAYPIEYKIQYASETETVAAGGIADLTWNTIAEIKDGNLSARSTSFLNKNARYVRVLVDRYNGENCALLELNVYAPDKTKTLESLGEEINILFIGNSITYYNNVWSQFEGIALSKGHNVHATACVYGGKSLVYHSTSHNAETAIKAGNFDYVVLQDICSSFTKEKLTEGAAAIVPKIKEYNPYAKIIFYETWPKRDSKDRTPEFIEGYLATAKTHGAGLAPVGEAFYDLNKTRSYEYYETDGTHPQPAGSFLAASTIYYAIFTDEAPLSLTNRRYNYINTLINANVADSKSGIKERYGSDVISLIDELAHKYAQAVIPVLKDTTGEATYTSVATVATETN